MQAQVKYLIIGQGLVGSWMCYQLDKAGISYKIVNDETIQSASSVSSGVINPVTGRRIVQTWMIETILPYAVKAYTELQEKLNIHIIQEAPVILLHPSEQMKESFNYRMIRERLRDVFMTSLSLFVSKFLPSVLVASSKVLLS